MSNNAKNHYIANHYIQIFLCQTIRHQANKKTRTNMSFNDVGISGKLELTLNGVVSSLMIIENKEKAL